MTWKVCSAEHNINCRNRKPSCK